MMKPSSVSAHCIKAWIMFLVVLSFFLYISLDREVEMEPCKNELVKSCLVGVFGQLRKDGGKRFVLVQ